MLSRADVYMCVERLGISWYSISLSLIGPCEGYTWVHTQAESLCVKEVCSYCYSFHDLISITILFHHDLNFVKLHHAIKYLVMLHYDVISIMISATLHHHVISITLQPNFHYVISQDIVTYYHLCYFNHYGTCISEGVITKC